ncbi:hypothetical protein [Brevibacillus sp. 179-C9.3 HS]|uniref:hypothetical protein n=1 Tax=unclassified Brevibacillus TaxID=2684853 RepID=UPI0039A104B4
MTKQVQEKVGLIAQAQAEYEAIVEEVRGYCQKARELRQQADEMRCSGSTDPQVATEIRKLLEQADYYNLLADQKDGHPRLEILRRLDGLEREASGLRRYCTAQRKRISPSTDRTGKNGTRSCVNGTTSKRTNTGNGTAIGIPTNKTGRIEGEQN